MRRPGRRLLPLLLAVGGTILSLAAPATGLAMGDTAYPTSQSGDRGTDVRALQLLVTARGFPVTADGIFGPATATAIVAWKTAARIVPATPIVDAVAWGRLIRSLGRGSSGPAVRAVQLELRAKRHASVTADGVWSASTTAAVKAFQRHIGSIPTGRMNATSWRRLIAHFEPPTFDRRSLCDYSVGNGPANWGTAAAIGALEAAAKVEAAAGYGRVAVGDIGFEHGGRLPGHHFHQVGLEIDVRLMRKANDQCVRGVTYRSAAYDRTATRALIQAIRASGNVKLIYFNDPILIKEGLTRRYVGHDDHLHVRFCEVGELDPRFDC